MFCVGHGLNLSVSRRTNLGLGLGFRDRVLWVRVSQPIAYRMHGHIRSNQIPLCRKFCFKVVDCQWMSSL